MNRDIKFRAWDDKNKKWLFGYDYQNLGGFSMFGETILCGEYSAIVNRSLFLDEWDYLKLMQYTGLKDQNGKEIYEGDIVKCIHLKSDGVSVLIEETTTVEWIGMGFQPLIRHSNYFMEVIGNIYENANLVTHD